MFRLYVKPTIHNPVHYGLLLFNAVGVCIWGKFVIEQMLEYLAFQRFQDVGHVIMAFGNATFEADLVIDFEADD